MKERMAAYILSVVLLEAYNYVKVRVNALMNITDFLTFPKLFGYINIFSGLFQAWKLPFTTSMTFPGFP